MHNVWPFFNIMHERVNPISANPTKWSDTLKLYCRVGAQRVKYNTSGRMVYSLPLIFSRERNQVERKVERKRLDYSFVFFFDFEAFSCMP